MFTALRSKLYEDATLHTFIRRSETYVFERMGRVIDNRWLIFFGLKKEGDVKKEFLTLGLEYITAWARKRIIIGSRAFETYVFWFVEHYLICEGIEIMEAKEVVVNAPIEKVCTSHLAVEVEYKFVVAVAAPNEEKVDRIGDWAVHVDQVCGLQGLQSVKGKMESLGFDDSYETLDGIQVAFEDYFTPYFDVRVFDDRIGWKFKIDVGNGSVKGSYLGSLGLSDGKDSGEAFRVFNRYLNDVSFQSDRPIYFNYEWIAEEFFEAYEDSAKLEEFIIKYARILIMRPCYIGTGPLSYILIRDWGDLDINVYEFMSVPILVNNLLGSFVVKNGGGDLSDLDCFVEDAVNTYERCKKPSKILSSVLGLLNLIGVSRVYLSDFLTLGWRSELVGASKVLGYCNYGMYHDEEVSFDFYYNELLVCCSLDSSPREYLEKVDYYSPVKRKVRNKKRGNLNMGGMSYDQDGESFIVKSTRYKDVVMRACEQAVHSTLVDEKPGFIYFILKRLVLSGCYSDINLNCWLSEFRRPMGGDVQLSSFREFVDSCAQYVDDLVRRGIYDRDIFTNSELMSYLRMSRLAAVWGRSCLAYFGVVVRGLS